MEVAVVVVVVVALTTGLSKLYRFVMWGPTVGVIIILLLRPDQNCDHDQSWFWSGLGGIIRMAFE